MAKGIMPTLISTEIIEIAGSPIILVGQALLDGKVYGVFIDPTYIQPISEVHNGWVNELYMNKTHTVLIDNFVIYDDEEWTIISDFFDKCGLYEMQRIQRWVWAQFNGMHLIPRWMYEEADKKRPKIIGMKRSTKIDIAPRSLEAKTDIKWRISDNTTSTKTKATTTKL